MTLRLKEVLILSAVVFVLYANILPNPFVWDDNIFIVQNTFIKEWKNLPLLFKSDFFSKSYEGSTFEKGGYYRPLVMVLYTLEYHLWGKHASGYHFVSILLHLSNVLLVYLLFQKLFQDRSVSFLGALLFASHPLQSEAVSYCPSRGDLLATLFTLSTFLASLSKRRFLRTLSPMFFLFALLSKEAAVILPFLLLGYGLSFGLRRNREWLFSQLCCWTLLFLYALLRLTAFPLLNASPEAGCPVLFLRVLSLGKLVFSYLVLLFIPTPLHLERKAPFQTTFWDPGTLAAIALFGGAVGLGRFLWRKNRTLFFGMVWFLIGLIPVSNIIPLYPSMAEHYLYFPSIGFFAIVSFALYHLYLKVKGRALRRLLVLFGVLVLGTYGGLIFRRNRDYSDDLRLFQQTLVHAPQSAGMHGNLGAVYAARGFAEEAKREFELSLSLNPDQPVVWANLGTWYREREEYDKAILLFKKLLERNSRDAAVWNKLGIAYAKSGKGDALAAFTEAARLEPGLVEAYFNLGSAYWEKGDLERTAFFWGEALKRDSDYPALKQWLPLLREKMSKKK